MKPLLMDSILKSLYIVDKLVKKFKFNVILLLQYNIVVIIIGKISKMNSLYYGVLWTFFFFIDFIISAEMTSFSLDDEG